jgi:hypothetical protein
MVFRKILLFLALFFFFNFKCFSFTWSFDISTYSGSYLLFTDVITWSGLEIIPVEEILNDSGSVINYNYNNQLTLVNQNLLEIKYILLVLLFLLWVYLIYYLINSILWKN